MAPFCLLVVFWIGVVPLGMTPHASAGTVDLTGTWTTADGTMVAMTHRDGAVEARSLVPNPQMANQFGWKSGDLVFRGVLVDGMITGEVAYHFPVQAEKACAGKAVIMLRLEMQVLGSDQLLGRAQHRILGGDCALSDGPWSALEFTRRSFDVKETASEITIEIRDDILFDLDRATLEPNAVAVLSELKHLVLDQQRFARIVIEGHTDSQGTDAHNLALSLQRARAVSRWLVERGVAENQLEPRGLGRSRPLVSNATAANRARNRRVEIRVIK